MEDPVTAANTALAPTVAIPIPPLTFLNPEFITVYMSDPSPALETISPMKVKSGTVAKVYSMTLSPIAILRRLTARSKLSRISRMDTKETRPSAIGM